MHPVGDGHGAGQILLDQDDRRARRRSAPAARRRRGRRPAATGRATPRRAAGYRDCSSARGRSPSPAARRPTDCRLGVTARLQVRKRLEHALDAPVALTGPTSCRAAGSPRPSSAQTAGALPAPARGPCRRAGAQAPTVMSASPSRMRPPAGRCAPAMALSSVVLPAPLAPTSASVSPRATLKLTSRTACSRPCRTPRFSTASTLISGPRRDRP